MVLLATLPRWADVLSIPWCLLSEHERHSFTNCQFTTVYSDPSVIMSVVLYSLERRHYILHVSSALWRWLRFLLVTQPLRNSSRTPADLLRRMYAILPYLLIVSCNENYKSRWLDLEHTVCDLFESFGLCTWWWMHTPNLKSSFTYSRDIETERIPKFESRSPDLATHPLDLFFAIFGYSTPLINLCTKFEVCTFTRSMDVVAGTKIITVGPWHDLLIVFSNFFSAVIM